MFTVKNMKVRTFLILSFSVLLALTAALGTNAIYYTQRMAGQTIEFYQGPHKIQTEVERIRWQLSYVGSMLRDGLLFQTPETVEKARKTIDENLSEMTEHIALVREGYGGDPQLIENAADCTERWLAQVEAVTARMEAGDFAEARASFFSGYPAVAQSLTSAVASISDQSAESSALFFEEAQQDRARALRDVTVLVAVILLAMVPLLLLCLRSIDVPLREIGAAVSAMEQGNLHYDLRVRGKNEFGRLADEIRGTMAALSGYVDHTAQILGRMAAGDMTVSVALDYRGDFAPIKLSMEKIAATLGGALGAIGESADAVWGSAQQVANGAQILSQGATEQAGSVEELSSTLAEIAEQVRQGALEAEAAEAVARRAGDQLRRGNEQVGSLLEAVREIEEASGQIAEIIGAIEDIAFQTNLLALNAAVEAAHAGNAGRGFAVVADEVRTLAGRSAQAAQNTNRLIKRTVHAVRGGTEMAGRTAEEMEAVLAGAQEISRSVLNVSKAAKEQSAALEQVTAGIDQISQVVQMTSATSQQSAAASEELAGQARGLRELVAGFHTGKEEQTPAAGVGNDGPHY